MVAGSMDEFNDRRYAMKLQYDEMPMRRFSRGMDYRPSYGFTLPCGYGKKRDVIGLADDAIAETQNFLRVKGGRSNYPGKGLLEDRILLGRKPQAKVMQTMRLNDTRPNIRENHEMGPQAKPWHTFVEGSPMQRYIKDKHGGKSLKEALNCGPSKMGNYFVHPTKSGVLTTVPPDEIALAEAYKAVSAGVAHFEGHRRRTETTACPYHTYEDVQGMCEQSRLATMEAKGNHEFSRVRQCIKCSFLVFFHYSLFIPLAEIG